MATAVTKFPADGGLGKSVWVELNEKITLLIALGHITTASTIAELQTALTGETSNTDPRS